MEKVMESHRISKAQKSTNPVHMFLEFSELLKPHPPGNSNPCGGGVRNFLELHYTCID